MALRFAILVLLFQLPAVFAGQQKTAASPAEGDFQISGTLVDADTAQPLAHARVSISSIARPDDSTVIVTSDDGRFLFAGLAPGKYVLSGQARGHLLQAFNQHDSFSSSIAVGPGLDSTGLIFKLPAEASISGTVVDEGGEPVRDANLSLYTTGLSAGLEATRVRNRTATNDEGAYHFSHLSPGHYLLVVSAQPWYARFIALASNNAATEPPPPGEIAAQPGKSPLDLAYPITFFGGATDATAATEIHLARGERFTANINLQPVPAVHLRFATENDGTRGRSIVLEQHVLDGPPLPVPIENRFINQGVMESLVGVAPGHYTMRTFMTGKNGAAPVPSQEIDVGSNGGIDNDETYVPVSAALAIDSGDLPRQIRVNLLNKKSRQSASEAVGDQGEVVFKQGIRPGTYEVSLFNNQGTYLRSVSAEGARLSGRTLEVKAGASVRLKIAVGRGFGDISGIALRDGKPVAGAMVVLVPPDPAHNQVLFRRDQSDSDGTFGMKNVVPGNYTLVAIENGWDLEWMNPTVLRTYLARGNPVVVQSNAKVNDVKLAVQ
ncbi:MAG TPA: carboxypeptidase regulatory-like domain-containing protein [Candidatus Angelobacter sp.]|nr:carboxypeptidase regulatory-like domain-containing protein [Candidatus Angelobacter sp.]